MYNDEQIYQEYNKYHTFGARFWAIWFDSIIVLPIYYLWLFLAYTYAGSIGKDIVNLFSSCIIYIYYLIMHGLFGQTLGKMIFEIKLYSIDETKVKWKQCIIRELIPFGITIISCIILGIYYSTKESGIGYSISHEDSISIYEKIVIGIYLLWQIIVFVSIILNRDRRGLQDKIAGTIITKKSNVKVYRALLVVILAIIVNSIRHKYDVLF